MTTRGTMRKTIATTITVGALLALTGCGSDEPVSQEAPAPAATTQAAPVPEPEYATVQQVASVIAAYAADWRETIEAADSCRIIHATGAQDVQEDVELATCFMRESAMTYSAQTVTTKWGELNIPPELQELVADTEEQLDKIVEADVAGNCKDDESEECSTALGAVMMPYTALASRLNAWAPYL